MRALTLILALLAGPALAVFPESNPDPALVALKLQIETGDAATARGDLERLLTLRPDNADVLNLLGFASRKLGDWDVARSYYDRALRANPEHRGALEYLGELELQLGRTAEARALEARLAAICFMGCDELDDLRAAIAAAPGG